MMVVGLLVPAVWLSVPSVLFAAVVSGFGLASYALSAAVAVSSMPFEHDGERVGMIGWLQMGNSASAVLGPMVAGLMIDQYGFGAAYAALATAVGCSLVVTYRVKLPVAAVVAEVKQRGQSVVLQVFSDPRVLRIYLLSMAGAITFDGFSFMTPVLGQERGFSATTIGLILSCFAIGTFASRALLPRMSRHLSEWPMMAVAFLVSAVAFCLLPFLSHAYIHATLGFVCGMAAGVNQPNILSLIYRALPPSQAGEGAGLRAMMGNIMGLTGPSLFGGVSALFGAAPVFLIVGGASGIASWQARRGYKLSLDAPEAGV
jgi:predicted MFS family arabinose efflux permease